mgnify:CR=1 FL=1
MANQALLTTQAKLTAALQTYFSLTATIPALQSPTVPLSTVYAFLSRSKEWMGLTELPTQDVAYLKQSQKNMIVAKRINSADITLVAQRIDWKTDTVYEEYSDTMDMFATDIAGNLVHNFYIKNSFDQVFKCLSNNGGAPSIVEPFFQPGQYNTQNIFQSTDGYKWKFMYTIDIGSKIKFMDSNWMPVPIGFNVPNSFQTSEGCGGVEVINVINGGSGFSNSNVITVVITGDGTGATASVSGLDGSGSIQDIQVTNPGSNYTFANVSFISASGSGAIVSAPTSPVGGHGFDPISELGCRNIMVSVEFESDENLNGVSYLPTDIKYYQMGLVINPTDSQNFPSGSNTTIFKTTTDLQVSQGSGQFQFDEIVYQSTDGAYQNRFWEGTVLHYDDVNNVINTINTTGSPITGAQIYGQSSTTTRTLLTVTKPNYDLFSGYTIYLQNLDGVTRSSDGIEQFKIVLGH